MTGAPIAAAALAGVPAGVQAFGPWAGRRQVFIRFAGEAETATMYLATALSRELTRQVTRGMLHSVCIGGRDPLGNVPFLQTALEQAKPPLPVMLDCDGQRPDAIAAIAAHLALVQVTVDFTGPEAALDRAVESLAVAAQLGVAQALAIVPKDDTTDALILRLVSQAHAAAPTVQVVIHPAMPAESAMLDRRWANLLEQAMGLHADTRLALRLPPPTGMR